MLKFDDKKVVGKIQIEMPLTESDIETIIVNGFEGGINYWARFDKSKNLIFFKDKPKDEPISTWATKVILKGGYVNLSDVEEEDDGIWMLTLENIIEGFRLNYINRNWDNNLEQGDATTSDCILQYALFGDVVYG